MGPRIKTTAKDIIQGAVAIIRTKGIEKLNARELAKQLKCSTQPIFSNFASMEELHEATLKEVREIYRSYVEKGSKRLPQTPYKGAALGYIEFATKERNCFKFMFMRERINHDLEKDRQYFQHLVDHIQTKYHLTAELAYRLHIEMWVFIHGIAVMHATNYLKIDDTMIDDMLSDVFLSVLERHMKLTNEGEKAFALDVNKEVL